MSFLHIDVWSMYGFFIVNSRKSVELFYRLILRTIIIQLPQKFFIYHYKCLYVSVEGSIVLKLIHNPTRPYKLYSDKAMGLSYSRLFLTQAPKKTKTQGKNSTLGEQLLPLPLGRRKTQGKNSSLQTFSLKTEFFRWG